MGLDDCVGTEVRAKALRHGDSYIGSTETVRDPFEQQGSILVLLQSS